MPLPQLIYRSVLFQALIVVILFGVSVPNAHGMSHSPLACNPHSLWFDKVLTGQSETLPVTMINNGSSAVTVSTVNVDNAAFTVNNFTLPMTLTPGQSIQFSVTFSPTQIGSVGGTIGFSNGSGTLEFSVKGKGVVDWSLTANPTSLNFGNVAITGSLTLPLTLSNPGTTTQTVSVGRIGGAGFSVTGVKLPLILAAGESFTFNVTFAPLTAGPANGSILVSSPTNPALIVPLSGVGTAMSGQLSVSPASINFGNVNVGQNSSQGGQLTASASGVTVYTATMSNPAFSLSGISLPVTLAAGQSVNFTVSFGPQTGGQASGTLSFASNAANSPTVEALAGTGNSTPYSVNLSWNPSVSQVVGYNVYRSNQSSGPYSRINSVLDPNTTYTDSSVVDGQTYYYATTAVNLDNQESAYSNLSQAVIP